ncbi:hypothetical protein Tco_0677835, partial [Tanacetum coccineum]
MVVYVSTPYIVKNGIKTHNLWKTINHDDAFKKPPKKVGEVNWIDNIDSDAKCVNEVSDMMKKIGYDNVAMKYYFKEPNIEFDKDLRKLATDIDVLEMLKFVSKYKFLDNDADEVLDDVRRNRNVHNLVITKHVANEGNAVSEYESESKYGSDSDDSDFIVDEESLIHDVDVDMQDFNNNTDANVEWMGCKEFVQEVNKVFNAKEDIDFEDFDSGTKSRNKGVRKKAIRQLGKMNNAEAGEIWKENLYVGQEFANSQLIKDMITRVFVEQRRELHLKKND